VEECQVKCVAMKEKLEKKAKQVLDESGKKI
jgi:hypothetical protein